MSENKRILVVCQHFWPESFRINDICDYFVENGCEVDVLCGLPNYPKGYFPEGYGYFKNRKQVHNNIHIYRAIEIPRGNNTNIRIFLNYISFPFTSLFHIPRLLTKKYDKIFLYQLSPVMMSIAGIIIGKIKKTETTMYVLDLWPENLFSVIKVNNKHLKKVAYVVSNWHYRNVDKLVVLSETMKKRLIEVTNIPEEKIIVIPQTCEKVYETEIHDKNLAKRFSSGFNIVYAGNISPAQSFETIIEAAKILKSQNITGINWIILGEGMSKKWLVDKVHDKHLENEFFFEGQKPIKDVPKYTSIADVLIGCLVKSDLLEATIPAKVISYLAAGKPVVLAMDGEVQQLINDTIGCGFAGQAQDAMLLAHNIRKIHILKREERNLLGKRARNYYFGHFERSLLLAKLYNFMFNMSKV